MTNITQMVYPKEITQKKTGSTLKLSSEPIRVYNHLGGGTDTHRDSSSPVMTSMSSITICNGNLQF